MAKLNSDDHKGFDIGAKIVKCGLFAAAIIGSIFLGKASLDSKNNDDDDNNDDSGDDQA